MGIYALAAKKLTAAVNGRLKAKPRNGAQRRTTHNGAVVCRCAPLRGFYRPAQPLLQRFD